VDHVEPVKMELREAVKVMGIAPVAVGHGHCASGGCNRMNVFDWLANLPFADPESNCRIIEVSFNNGSRKDYFKNASLQYFKRRNDCRGRGERF